jgi:MinD-like ATPase involved in chromosome partitioning or flagellar assembly
MNTALGFNDRSLERQVLGHLDRIGAHVVRRCISSTDANSLPLDIELIIDSSFRRKYGDQLQRPYRVLSSFEELAYVSTPLPRSSSSLVVFCGISGGVGTTSLTLYSAAQVPSTKRLLVIDADLFRPAAHVFVSTPISESTNNLWMAIEQSSLRAAEPWQTNVWFLSGIGSPSRRRQIDGDAWNALLDAALMEFDEVRVDLGNHVADEHPVVTDSIKRAETCVLIAKAHPASAVAFASIHRHLARQTSVVTVINQLAPGPIGATSQRIIGTSVGEEVLTIADDRQSFDDAFIAGTGLGDGKSRSAIDLLNCALPGGSERVAPPATGRVDAWTPRRSRRRPSLRG